MGQENRRGQQKIVAAQRHSRRLSSSAKGRSKSRAKGYSRRLSSSAKPRAKARAKGHSRRLSLGQENLLKRSRGQQTLAAQPLGSDTTTYDADNRENSARQEWAVETLRGTSKTFRQPRHFLIQGATRANTWGIGHLLAIPQTGSGPAGQ